MRHLISKTNLIAATIVIPGTAALAATTDSIINNANEYSFNTEAAPNSKHNADNHASANSEYNDGSGCREPTQPGLDSPTFPAV